MRKLSVLILLLLSLSLASGEIQYEIELDEQEVYMNTSIQMDCGTSCPRLGWSLMDDARVLNVEDGGGKLDYTLEDGRLDIQGRRTFQDTRTIRIETMVEKEADHVFDGLHRRSFSLPSFRDRRTTGFIRVENLVSGRTGYGFDSSYGDNELRFVGEGPTNIRVNFGEGDSTEYFVFFGDRQQDIDDAYRIAVGTLQIVPEFRRLAVAVMPDKDYESSVNSWSAGEYVSGSIRMRDSLDEKFMSVLAHEAVHGLNDRYMKWDRTRSDYFDEGTAEYVEFLMEKKLYSQEEIDIGPSELFGEEKRYRKPDERRTYYRVPSQGDREELWNYYQEDNDFMKRWNPRDFPERRSFGYAYSHLLVRHHMMEGGALNEIYRAMSSNQEIEDPEEKWSFFSQHMDMTPCKYDSRERFDRCLDDVNSYDYTVRMAEPDFRERQINITRLELPNRTYERPSVPELRTDGEPDIGQFLKGFIEYLGSRIQALLRTV